MLDYRRIEKVQCAGIPISTFLSDDRQTILVSATELQDALSMHVDLEEFGCEMYVAYDIGGRAHDHMCITHQQINEFLWTNPCKSGFEFDLDDFRRFFSYEVISFWKRFEPASASLSVREAIRVIDRKVVDYHKRLGIPTSRVFEEAFSALGYDKVPLRDDMPTEELAFIAYIELLYSSMANFEIEAGHPLGEALRIVEGRLRRPMKELGNITRGVTGI